jgi:hypothetical protein
MLRIHGDRDSLLAALTALWADQQLRIPEAQGLGNRAPGGPSPWPKAAQGRDGLRG